MSRQVVHVIISASVILMMAMSVAQSQSIQEARALSKQVEQLISAGRYAEALPLAQRASGAFSTASGPNSEEFVKSLNNLALLYKEALQLDEAEATFEHLLNAIPRVFGPDHINFRTALRNIAAIQLDRRRFSDCESTLRRGLESAERSKGANSFDAASFLIGLGVVYLNMGRPEEARSVYDRARNIAIATGGASSVVTAAALSGLASVAQMEGKWVEARQYWNAGLQLDLRNPELKSRSYPIRSKAYDDTIDTIEKIAAADEKSGNLKDAESNFRRALAIAERELAANHPTTTSALSDLGEFLLRNGRAAEAEPLLARALRQNEAAYGQANLVSGYYIDSLADSVRAQGRIAEALALIQKPAGDRDRNKSIHLRVLHAAMAAGLLSEEAATEAALQAVQRGQRVGAAGAISSLAARFAAGTDDLAVLVRADQDLAAESESLVRTLVEAASAEPRRRNETVERQLRQQLVNLDNNRRRVSLELATRFPRYTSLSRSRSLTLDQVRGLLQHDETLIVFDIDAESFVWAVSKTKTQWLVLDIRNLQLETAVSKLRNSLTFERDLPFDLETASELYRLLFGQLEAAGTLERRLLIVANGALTSLPFQVLTPGPSTGRLYSTEWLVSRHAIGILPSVESLAALRNAPPVQAPLSSMIAFADPLFQRSTTPVVEPRGRAPSTKQPALSRLYKGSQVDLTELRRLSQLPGTRREVEAISGTMVGAVELRMGAEATEGAVKRSRLNRFRIVYFATHGLVAGDLKSLDERKVEPALALTVPDRATVEDDGLLQASEIAKLNLDAEWVVLSACNTASGQRPGAEALSGLAQAFIYAGARTLMVSHWDVSDDATATLMTDVFRTVQSNPGVGHLEALQKAQVKMISDAQTEDDRHPRRWAPFVVVGEARGIR